MINRRKIIYLLVAIVAGLLIINALLGLTKKKIEHDIQSELNQSQIEEKFLFVLDGFGLDEKWISKHKIKKGKFDSLSYQFNIKLPSDIPIPLVLKDLNEVFLGERVLLTSEEKKIQGITNFNIKAGDYTKLISEFKYYPDLSRPFSKVGFLLTDFPENGESKLENIFNLNIPVGILLPLETESQEAAERIKIKNMEYFIELDNDSDDPNFELDEDLTVQQLSSNVKNIISSFNSPRIFFINEQRSGFNLSINNFLLEGFQKRGRKILSLKKIVNLKGQNKSDLNSLVKFHLNNLNYGESKVFKISINDWQLIQDELNTFLKMGNKIVHPAGII